MAGAKLLGRLSDGPTNASFLAESDGRQYVLRLDKPGAVELGLNRLNEYRVAKAVSEAGLAPQPIFIDPGEGVYLRRFLQGRNWTIPDLDSPVNLDRLADLLRNLHGLPPVGDAFDPLAAARRYAVQLDSDESRMILGKAERLMGEIIEDSPGQALCHNDLVCQNILEGEPLMLIDWEYAGIGHPFFDLAVVVQHHALGPALRDGFLESYLGRPAAAGEQAHLELQCQFYACLLQLWNLRIASVGAAVGAGHARD